MRVLTPTTLDEARRAYADTPGAVPMGGGTDLLVHWPSHVERHDGVYLDLSGVAELCGMRWTDDALELGAMTTYWDVQRDDRVWDELPLLTHAARQVGAVQIQTRGTWGGNIANASPAADGVPVLMVYDATVTLGSASGTRDVKLDSFYTGYKQSVMEPGELIERISVPLRPRTFERFEKVGTRAAQSIAKVGVAAVREDPGWRIVASSVAPFVTRCPRLEALLDSGSPLGSPDDLLGAIRADVKPIDDLRSTAAYRERVFARVLFSLVKEERAQR